MFKKFTEIVAKIPAEDSPINEEQSALQKQIERGLNDAVVFKTLLAQIAALGFQVSFKRINTPNKPK